MLKRAGNEIMRAHKSCLIPLANSTSLSNLAILKIRRTRRRLGLTAPSFVLNSSSTTSVDQKKIKVVYNAVIKPKLSYFAGLVQFTKILNHLNHAMPLGAFNSLQCKHILCERVLLFVSIHLLEFDNCEGFGRENLLRV